MIGLFLLSKEGADCRGYGQERKGHEVYRCNHHMIIVGYLLSNLIDPFFTARITLVMHNYRTAFFIFVISSWQLQ